MDKNQIIIQRRIGAILSKLSNEDSEILSEYLKVLENAVYGVKTKTEPQQEPSIFQRETRGKKPLGSKYFTENEIHDKMFQRVKGQSAMNIDGDIYTINNVSDLQNLNHDVYRHLRNTTIPKMHYEKNKVQC